MLPLCELIQIFSQDTFWEEEFCSLDPSVSLIGLSGWCDSSSNFDISAVDNTHDIIPLRSLLFLKFS